MGSRYGGLKQLDPVGPAGETLLDYSVHDAIRAGFDRVVFLIRREIEKDFRDQIGARYEGRLSVVLRFPAARRSARRIHSPGWANQAMGHRTRRLVRARGGHCTFCRDQCG